MARPTIASLTAALATANSELITAGRTIEALRLEVAKLRPIGPSQPRLAFGAPRVVRPQHSAPRVDWEARRALERDYFACFPYASSVTADELREFAANAEHAA